ncbi:bifunctional chorismate-binding protein/class IV aminotransferase [Neisseria animalis]|uniref:Bifunctional aminodeoxychorismate synthase component I/aminodeoxychorismate lyase n=1 Tax=Neisseria animalis TaxID=492 RepID=A0A5P3MWH6_NEIAN|nr:bifunctional anthranilate synthase component I family protein/class IV aminotransferase [Neisseria animalis]QEY25009.1 bifunctional aminodeoxychorismate synthase component I/aminodeoxychorismate lyase [Neisseria animalis]ROW32258.1 bifunctional aminodeoxychorismate synthase component I/aminodeoxychorismate lyase [Neisseria animalis]VEE06453.1 para-aminobenzoate synthase component I [Neisseria animalis]
MPFFVLLDDAVSGSAKLYQNHRETQFVAPEDLDKLDSLLQQNWAAGLHAVICADYAFGLPLQNLPSANSGRLALHWFEHCDTVDAESWLAKHSDGLPAGISTPQSDMPHTGYLDAVCKIHEAIRRGDTYQINYTTRLHFKSYGSPVSLYRRLRQPVPYAALAHLPQHGGGAQWTLCFSPELFLKTGSDGLITTEPMKGTAPVLHDGHDDQRAHALQADPKNRAENIMIVDLLRNDLGKIAVTGGVRVPEPFKVSRFGSVWQMTSKIEAQAKEQVCAADIFRAAFPCGSITGAPKRMSMQIIENLETSPRGLYTGSIGFLQPCSGGLGFEGVLNVVIRTLQLNEVSDGIYDGEYGVGSGIVIDSDPQAEYEECGWKARFLSGLRPEFGLIETLRVENNRCALLERHLGRLNASAAALNLPLPDNWKTHIRAALQALPPGLCRLKISLTSDGLTFTHAEARALSGVQKAVIAPQTLPVRDYLRRFKTDRRDVFDRVWQNAEAQGAFDGLLFNSDGLLLEGGRSNVFVNINGAWHTPALDLDILNGVMRQEVLQNPRRYLGTDKVSESHITRGMLAAAEEIRLSNALRGVFAVCLLDQAV